MSLVSPGRVERVATFARGVVRLYRERDVPFMAGSVAYSAFVSLIPLVLLFLIAASILGGEALQQAVLEATDRYLSPTSQGILQESITDATGQVGFSIFGAVAFVWSLLKVFRSLHTAFAALYGDSRDSRILEQLRDGVVVVGVMTMALLTMIGAGTAVALMPDVPFVGQLSTAALVAGLTAVFVPIYYVFPDVPVTFPEIIPGAVVAAVGWTALQALFRVYVSMSSAGHVYGVVGGVILILTWLYVGSVILLLGAATNVVLAGRDRQNYRTHG